MCLLNRLQAWLTAGSPQLSMRIETYLTIAWRISIGLLIVVFILGLMSFVSLPNKMNPLMIWFVLLGGHFLALIVQWCFKLSIVRWLFNILFKGLTHFLVKPSADQHHQGLTTLIEQLALHNLLHPLRLLLTHALWLSYFLGITLALLLYFLFNQVDFALESTLIQSTHSSFFFGSLFSVLNYLPQFLGFPSIDEQTVTLSLQASTDDHIRQLWAYWLVGQLLIWGAALRLLLMVYQALLIALRVPKRPLQAIATQVIDPAPAASHTTIQRHKVIHFTKEKQLIYFEIPSPYLTAPLWKTLSPLYIDKPASRRALVTHLSDNPLKYLLIVVNANATPEQGSLRFICQLMDHAQYCAIYLHTIGLQTRLIQWQDKLTPLLLANEQLFTQESELLQWWPDS